MAAAALSAAAGVFLHLPLPSASYDQKEEFLFLISNKQNYREEERLSTNKMFNVFLLNCFPNEIVVIGKHRSNQSRVPTIIPFMSVLGWKCIERANYHADRSIPWSLIVLFPSAAVNLIH